MQPTFISATTIFYCFLFAFVEYASGTPFLQERVADAILRNPQLCGNYVNDKVWLPVTAGECSPKCDTLTQLCLTDLVTRTKCVPLPTDCQEYVENQVSDLVRPAASPVVKPNQSSLAKKVDFVFQLVLSSERICTDHVNHARWLPVSATECEIECNVVTTLCETDFTSYRCHPLPAECSVMIRRSLRIKGVSHLVN